jgi:hypothetical protein
MMDSSAGMTVHTVTIDPDATGCSMCGGFGYYRVNTTQGLREASEFHACRACKIFKNDLEAAANAFADGDITNEFTIGFNA